MTATVLRDSVGNFDDDVMSIDVGHRHGVAPGMAVVTSAGFVGRVETVDAALSTVTTVSDPSLVIGVRLLDTGDVGLGHGMAGDSTRFVVDAGLRWPETGDLSELPAIGSPVVTAAGSRYPADIPVGRVAAVEPGGGGAGAAGDRRTGRGHPGSRLRDRAAANTQGRDAGRSRHSVRGGVAMTPSPVPESSS